MSLSIKTSAAELALDVANAWFVVVGVFKTCRVIIIIIIIIYIYIYINSLPPIIAPPASP